MKKVTEIAGAGGTRLRDRMRNVQRLVAQIARGSRAKGERSRRRSSRSTASGWKSPTGWWDKLRDFLKQAKRRGLKSRERRAGMRRRPHGEGKILSVFETSTEVIRKGKASKPTGFGKRIKIQEAENQIVIDYQVDDQKPSGSDLLIRSIETPQTVVGLGVIADNLINIGRALAQ